MPARAAPLLALLFAAACHSPRSDGPAAASSVSEKPGPSEPLPYSREGVAALRRAIRERCGDSCSLLMLELSPERAVVQLEARERLGQLVQYEWRNGSLKGPIPIELRGKGTLAQNLFPFAAVELEAIPSLVELARARIDRDNGTLRSVLIRRNLPNDDSVGIRVYIDSPLRSGQLDADARGRVLTL